MAGALKTFYNALQASQYINGAATGQAVNLAFGEEFIDAQEYAAPYIVMVPTAGRVDPVDDLPGYVRNLPQDTEMICGIEENVDFYLWGFNTDPTAQPVDHADAVETLRQLFLSALQDQRAQYVDVADVSYGLSYVPLGERWLPMGKAFTRAGRCLVFSINLVISITTIPSIYNPDATIETVEIDPTITPP
jgi:hypothetical protein